MSRSTFVYNLRFLSDSGSLDLISWEIWRRFLRTLLTINSNSIFPWPICSLGGGFELMRDGDVEKFRWVMDESVTYAHQTSASMMLTLMFSM